MTAIPASTPARALDQERFTVSKNGSVTASMDVTNTGDRKGDDVAQLYIHDPVASISQPVRRLRGDSSTADMTQSFTVHG